MFHLKQMHIQTTLLAIITPIAFILPSPLSTPLDLALGVLIPYHAHVGTKHYDFLCSHLSYFLTYFCEILVIYVHTNVLSLRYEWYNLGLCT